MLVPIAPMSITRCDWRAGELTEAQMRQVAAMHLAAFDDTRRTVDFYVEQRLRTLWGNGQGPDAASARLHVLFEGDRLLAKAGSFVRQVMTETGPIHVVALITVASHPDARGRGLGKQVVRAVFDRVDAGEAAACLFQTDQARGFYERMGCHPVDNRFINSTHATHPQANPWTDPVIMIYPPPRKFPPRGRCGLASPPRKPPRKFSPAPPEAPGSLPPRGTTASGGAGHSSCAARPLRGTAGPVRPTHIPWPAGVIDLRGPAW